MTTLAGEAAIPPQKGARGHLDLEIDALTDEATAGQLKEALMAYVALALGTHGQSCGSNLLVDGVAVPDESVLCDVGLRSGSVLALGGAGGAEDPGPDRRLSAGPVHKRPQGVVSVSGGLHSGRQFPFADTVVTIGRDEGCQVVIGDPTMSPRHARLTVSDAGCAVEDLRSLNGTRVDGVALRSVTRLGEGELVSMGATELTVGPPPGNDAHVGLAACASPQGTVTFNRPPRTALAPAVGAIPVPDPPAQQRRSNAFSLAALVGPVVMGVVMVQVMGNVRYALFALMAPVMLVTNLIASRRRNKKDAKSSKRRFKRDLALFETALELGATTHRRRMEARNPNLAEVLRRAEVGSALLWERRVSHPDYLELRLGRGPQPWAAPVDADRVSAAPALTQAVAARSLIDRCAVTVSLADNGVIGLVGDRSATLALVRAIVAQLAVHQGPADLPMAVLCGDDSVGDWDWTKWLPHVRPAAGPGMLFADVDAAQTFVASLLEDHRPAAGISGQRTGPRSAPARLLIVDCLALLAGRNAPTRRVLGGEAGPVAGVVVAPSVDELPAVCRHVVTLHDDLGDASLHSPGQGRDPVPLVAGGIPEAAALDGARCLARYEDPEVRIGDSALPSLVSLMTLLDPSAGADAAPGDTAQWIRSRWSRAEASALRIPVGHGLDGPLWLDLVADGPHVLIAGTTGAGKSEFLRSLIGALAATGSPDHVVLVLIDYKGGSAFDCCSELPHVVGLVTDLDDHLGERALVSLDAEIRHRELLLRRYGAADIAQYFSQGSPGGALPRLVLVVDEFATLANELPDFMGSLVSIAQRGRSLGVHLVLATQRPSGAVNANIKANTTIRIALRVQDAAESIDVVDSPVAADISRHTPGRAVVRLGPGELLPVQTALSSASSHGPKASLTLRPLRFEHHAEAPPSAESVGPSDLARLVEACLQLQEDAGACAPRRPWLPMVPALLPFGVEDNPEGFGVVDDPRHQRQLPLSWDPRNGHLGLFGMTGSGTSSALVVAVLHRAVGKTPQELHVYAVDFGGGSLDVLSGLAHTGAVVGANETERQVLLLTHLRSEVERRRTLTAERRQRQPEIVAAIDGLGAMLGALDGLEGQAQIDDLKLVLAEGAAMGVTVVATATRLPELPSRIGASFGCRLLFEHADLADFASAGLRAREVPSFVPGRVVVGESGLVGQVAHLNDPQAWLDERGLGRDEAPLTEEATAGLPLTLAPLPNQVSAERLVALEASGDGLRLPVGIRQGDHAPVYLDLEEGEHVLVSGPAKSGVSGALGYLASILRRQLANGAVVAVCSPRSPLRTPGGTFDAVGNLADLEAVLALAAGDTDRTWVVAVDDAHAIDSPGFLEPLLRARHCHILLGGRSQQFHGVFNHWSRHVRRHGKGVLLMPRLASDGDLLGVRLPRRLSTPLVAGRGFLVADGDATLVQVAQAEDAHEAA